MFTKNTTTIEIAAVIEEEDYTVVLFANGSFKVKTWDDHGTRTSSGLFPAWYGRIKYRRQLAQFRQQRQAPALQGA